ncbi:MAG TPA: phosphate ABC transporter, permease protein PstA, partial [Desulfobacteraceae bacterium]|nr:phosphate ABC transporter, permease protein PstA [Desulfobacteraceae bacterium]
MDIVNKGLAKRYKRERRFRMMGLSAIILSLAFLSLLFISIIANGYTAFEQTMIQLDVHLDAQEIDKENLAAANYLGLIRTSLKKTFPDVKKRRDKRKMYNLVSPGASFMLQDFVMRNRHEIGNTITIWVPADDDVDMLMKGNIKRDVPESERRMNDMQLSWVDKLIASGQIKKVFNTTFFTAGDSREPEP